MRKQEYPTGYLHKHLKVITDTHPLRFYKPIKISKSFTFQQQNFKDESLVKHNDERVTIKSLISDFSPESALKITAQAQCCHSLYRIISLTLTLYALSIAIFIPTVFRPFV